MLWRIGLTVDFVKLVHLRALSFRAISLLYMYVLQKKCTTMYIFYLGRSPSFLNFKSSKVLYIGSYYGMVTFQLYSHNFMSVTKRVFFFFEHNSQKESKSLVFCICIHFCWRINGKYCIIIRRTFLNTWTHKISL